MAFPATRLRRLRKTGVLREMVRETAGDASPERILVVDNIISEGSTWMLAAGLLELVFPEAAVRFYRMRLTRS